MSSGPIIGIDWGTTNRRCYLIEHGEAVAERRDGCGVLSMAPADYAPEIASLRDEWGSAPVLIAGMAGSNRGWRETAYLECPAGLESMAAAVEWVERGAIGIVPGVCQRSPTPDIMRGEEVQMLGAVAAGLVPAGALLCQPGTHCKWARIEDGAIAGFSTAMTGELYALLRERSLLAMQLQGAAKPGDAFRAGVGAAARASLLNALFGIRAASLLGARPDEDAASYASGLLIGSDVAAQEVGGRMVHLLAEGELGELYAAAIRHFGGNPVEVGSKAAFAAGIAAIWDQIR